MVDEVEELIKKLKDKDEYVRRKAALELGETKDERAVELLIKVLEKNVKSSVRGYAALALGEMEDERGRRSTKTSGVER